MLTLVAGCGFGASVPSQGGDGATDVAGDTTPVTTPTVRRITVAPGRVTGTHTDFPALFTAAITSAHPMGFDLHFSADQAGTMKLAHEIERYAPNELVAWVKVPALSEATEIYLHYGDTTITTSQENRPGVWTAGYAAVWHLSSLEDARAQNPVTANGGSAAPGKIAGARGFDGDDDVLDAGSNASLDDLFDGGGTMEAWFLATTYGEGGFGRIFDKGPSNSVLSMCNPNIANALLFGRAFGLGAGNWCTAANTIGLNQWTHVAVTYQDNSPANVPVIYINGTFSPNTALSTPSGAPTTDGAAVMTIGDRVGGGRAFEGQLDEARLSTVRHSADWIRACYENQREPATFFVLSPPL